MVTTTNILNFRDAPGGEILGLVAYNVSLTAIERTDYWFHVDNLGTFGWISADYVTPAGGCG